MKLTNEKLTRFHISSIVVTSNFILESSGMMKKKKRGIDIVLNIFIVIEGQDKIELK
jgi:hypothetical protein